MTFRPPWWCQASRTTSRASSACREDRPAPAVGRRYAAHGQAFIVSEYEIGFSMTPSCAHARGRARFQVRTLGRQVLAHWSAAPKFCSGETSPPRWCDAVPDRRGRGRRAEQVRLGLLPPSGLRARLPESHPPEWANVSARWTCGHQCLAASTGQVRWLTHPPPGPALPSAPPRLHRGLSCWQRAVPRLPRPAIPRDQQLCCPVMSSPEDEPCPVTSGQTADPESAWPRLPSGQSRTGCR